MKISEKQILAWLDGELDEAGTQQVEQAVQEDPELMARAEAHFLTMMQLKAAFAPLLELDEPKEPEAAAPELVGEPTQDAAEIRREPAIATPAVGPSLQERALAWAPPAARRWGPTVAALLLGLVIGRSLLGTTHHAVLPQLGNLAPASSAVARDEDGTLVAAGALADALENGVEPGDSTAVRIPLSFRDKSGRLCRSFDTARLAGIACRDRGGWRLRLTLESVSGGRSAASESPFVGQAVDAMIAGTPLDADQEKAAAAAGWR